MTRLIAFTLMPALLFSLGGSATAASEAATALEVCGRLVEHRPATATAAGSLTVGTRTYAVSPGTVAGNGGVEVAVGRDLCFEGSLGTTSRHLLRYLFFPLPRDQLCGTVQLTSGDTLTMASDFGALTVVRGPGVPAPATGDRVCYAFQISAQGDAVATRVEAVDTKNEREWISHCGTVRAYRPATPSAGGTITIGSKSFTIRAGVAYTGDPAGSRTDRTTTGSNMCLNGVFGPARELIEYLTGAMPTNIVGRTSEYTPPAGGVAGLAVLSYRSQFELRIPAAIDATVDLVRSSTCFETGVDAAGDIAARTVVPCEPGRAAGPSATGTLSPPPATAPAVSPSPTTTASAAPSATATRSPESASPASASPDRAGATTEPSDRPDPVLITVVMTITGLALVAAYLMYRRGRTG